MKALRLLAPLALLALVGTGGTAAETRAPQPLEIADLRFETLPGNPGEIQFAGDRDRMLITVGPERLTDSVGIALTDRDGPARFALVAEAGRADCAGKRRGGKAAGTCRFVSFPDFEVGLAQRRVTLERRRDLVSLALVDARLALVDDLAREGLAPATSGDLIAAAALEVTGAWVAELRAAGLQISEFDDLIAARALDLDARFLREMADAGYQRLTARQAIAMKAVGVTPSYAAAMNRATTAARQVVAAGALQ